MPILVASRRLQHKTLARRYGEARFLDVTSKGEQPWVRFSPFYPHGDIPVPFSPGVFGQSVEGVWQGLKVFEQTDIDPFKWSITTMKGIKRTVRRLGKVSGHRKGVHGEELLDYLSARRLIYLPCYRWVLDNRLQKEVATLRKWSVKGTVVLLDYETNQEVTDHSKPLSHAGLVARYIDDEWPSC